MFLTDLTSLGVIKLAMQATGRWPVFLCLENKNHGYNGW